ncbi:MAG TPA: FAD-dependent oxidoreductase, partial [Polyangiaceae bacterium]
GTEEDTEARYGALSDWTRARFGEVELTHRWSAQVLEPVDGLPYVGPSSQSDRVLYATGFSGNGITFGTLAAQMITDAILHRPNRFAEIFDARRVHLAASAKELVAENVDVPAHLIGDRLRPADASSVDDVAPGDGKITRVASKKCAVYRHDDGHLTVLSPVCPHLGCHVHFNGAEKTWDCPCHGSRFDVEGNVLDGPATTSLAKIATEE